MYNNLNIISVPSENYNKFKISQESAQRLINSPYQDRKQYPIEIVGHVTVQEHMYVEGYIAKKEGFFFLLVSKNVHVITHAIDAFQIKRVEGNYKMCLKGIDDFHSLIPGPAPLYITGETKEEIEESLTNYLSDKMMQYGIMIEEMVEKIYQEDTDFYSIQGLIEIIGWEYNKETDKYIKL